MKGIAYCLAGAAIVLGTPALARDFTVVNYGGLTQQAEDAAYFKPYIAATGKNLVVDQDPSLSKLRAMVETNNITWDLVDQESSEAIIGCDEGLFEQLDKSRLKLDAIPEETVLPCAVPIYTAGNVLAYDGDRLKDNPPTSWADFFDTKKWPGKRGIWNTPKGALELALMGDGVAPRDVYKTLKEPGGVDRAFKKLDTIKSDILVWNTGSELVNRLASGEYVMTFGWNARIIGANEADKRNFKIVWPAGFTWVTDYWVVPKGSPNLDQVYDFLELFAKPERQADFMKITTYSASNPKALELLTPERAALMPLSPENKKYGVPEDDDFWANNLDSLTERFNAWVAQQ